MTGRAVIAPLLPTNQPGTHRTDDRRLISGIIHVLRSGCRWQDCPACYGPPTTVYNRFHRWSAKGIWRRMFEALVQRTDRDIHMIDSTTAKAHRSAAGGKGVRCRSNRSLARRQIDKNPCCCRWLGPSSRVANSTWATRRRSRCHPTARASAPDPPLCGRHCLRRRRFARLPCNAWYVTSHSQQSNSKADQAV